MDPEVGEVYQDDRGRLMSVAAVNPGAPQGRDVTGHLLQNDKGQPVPYSTSLGIFRAIWTKKVTK